MPHLAPAWLTLPRVTMLAIAWVPVACALPLLLSCESRLAALPLLLLAAMVEGAAAWITVRALGRSFDKKGRAFAASLLAHTIAFSVMFLSTWGMLGAHSGDWDEAALLGGVLVGSSVQGGFMMSIWTVLLVGIATKRPRASSLNAADRTLALLGVTAAVPCLFVTMFGWMESPSLGAMCLFLTVLPPLAAAAFAALRVRAWRRWLTRVRVGDDARWRITATEGDRSTLCAIDAPAQPFREAEILIPVALIDRR
jgi:hypothetical protein